MMHIVKRWLFNLHENGRHYIYIKSSGTILSSKIPNGFKI